MELGHGEIGRQRHVADIDGSAGDFVAAVAILAYPDVVEAVLRRFEIEGDGRRTVLGHHELGVVEFLTLTGRCAGEEEDLREDLVAAVVDGQLHVLGLVGLVASGEGERRGGHLEDGMLGHGDAAVVVDFHLEIADHAARIPFGAVLLAAHRRHPVSSGAEFAGEVERNAGITEI